MSEQPKNVCVVCGKDCSFMATIDGLCIPCGDAIQVETQKDPTYLMTALVKACREVKSQRETLDRVTRMIPLLNDGDCRETEFAGWLEAVLNGLDPESED